MTDRLGGALAAHIRRIPGRTKFLLLEGIDEELAEGLTRAWADDLPPLAVASNHPKRFGAHALHGVSGTGLRNTHGEGLVLVICTGHAVPDRTSLGRFHGLEPGDLLRDPEGLTLLAQQPPAAPMDGPVRVVRQAILNASPATRPSAAAVAEYLDSVANGADPLEQLPLLGAFADHAVGPGVDLARATDNFQLAARRRSDEILRPSAFGDLRRRAERILARRPNLVGAPAAAADRFMALLQAGSDDLLQFVTFDEAREILEERAMDLPREVAQQLADYRRAHHDNPGIRDLPWPSYDDHARSLRRPDARRAAAGQLIALDDGERRAVFQATTRRKLDRLLRDRSISGTSPSCPEAALVRGIAELGGRLARIQLLEPQQTGAPTSSTAAARALTIACARLRLGGLMRAQQRLGVEIDGMLLQPANEDVSDETFTDADITAPSQLAMLRVRLHSDGGDTVQLDWRPDLDDAALLRAALLYSEQAALTLGAAAEPALTTFCSDAALQPSAVPPPLAALGAELRDTASEILQRGLSPVALLRWTDSWTAAVSEERARGRYEHAEALALAGGVTSGRAAALTPLAPLKAEWLAQYLEALWELVSRAGEQSGEPIADTAAALARITAAHYPAHLRLRTRDRALLPTSEGRIWTLYGGTSPSDDSGYGADALAGVLERLLTLQPEAAGHLRCLAYGPGAADLLVGQAVRLAGRLIGRVAVEKVELFCVGTGPGFRPSAATLASADDQLATEDRDALELRYLDDLDRAVDALVLPDGQPAVHLALVTGLTEGGTRLTIESPEVPPPPPSRDVLFTPRVWQRPGTARRTLLMPPTASDAGQLWLHLMNAVDDTWPAAGDPVRIPEIRTGSMDVAQDLRVVHDLAMWVATLDRYATRDSLEQSLGEERVAILHQERRLGGDSPLSLVISQKSGGPADRAIGRSLRAAGIVDRADVALSVGTSIRRVASQGYGILALEAATTGAGINELVGHVVAFSLLATRTTPWPLPPGCRVLLVSLDDYKHWFPSKRADLLAIALDTEEGGVHVAAIEVKARRSDVEIAAKDALDQLRQTLSMTRWAAYPAPDMIYSRLWLNRIAEAAYSVARESRFRLTSDELAALERFRLGDGTLEWAGVGLVFGPRNVDDSRHYPHPLADDRVPIVVQSIRLTEELLLAATSVQLTELRTVEAASEPLEGGRIRRRPETIATDERPAERAARQEPGLPVEPAAGSEAEPRPPDAAVSEPAPDARAGRASETGAVVAPADELSAAGERPEFHAPVLGWDATSAAEVRWHAAGPEQGVLRNGHAEVWGSSGMGKTQFAMALLAQLSRSTGSTFGIADFKNDYGPDSGFPQLAGAKFLDLWDEGAPYNPLALTEHSDRAIRAATIELRDTVDVAARSFMRMGHRQSSKLGRALEEAYRIGAAEQRWPTLRTLHDLLDADLAAVLGDLTGNDLFRDGPPLGDVIDTNVIFGLSRIPGNGQTTVLAAGFVLAALLLRIQNLPPVPNTIRYVTVVDEAHRVAGFRAIDTMIREGRSKGLAVLLATQQPGDLPEVVATNAQTKVCFRLPDATVAAAAARKLDPNDSGLPEQIRTLGVGEAFVSFGGEPPRLLNMAQAYRDAGRLGLTDDG